MEDTHYMVRVAVDYTWEGINYAYEGIVVVYETMFEVCEANIDFVIPCYEDTIQTIQTNIE